MVLGLKPMGKPSTKKKKSQVLDRTKAFHGPRTQAHGETKYLKEKLRYMDLRIYPRILNTKGIDAI